MPVEIERKFLVLSDEWRRAATGSQRLRDGMLARFGDGKVRVRVADDQAWLTVKGPRIGLRRPEFEYEIASAEAEEMLRTLCTEPLIEKTRHFVPYGGFMWEVDVYEGALGGLILTEIELEHEDQTFTMPKWLGREVTDDPLYKTANLFKLHADPQRLSGKNQMWLRGLCPSGASDQTLAALVTSPQTRKT
jgi:CYTH domain-containing protein